MNLPERFWDVRWAKLSSDENEDGDSLRSVVKSYFGNFDSVMKAGHGILFWGENGVGKTSAAALIAMEARRRARSVFFITEAEYIESVISKIQFDAVESVAERAKHVDLLVVDDFGKGHRDARGWTDRMFENLFRYRSARLKSIVLTMNISMVRFREECERKDLLSMVQLLKEMVLPVKVVGIDHRDELSSKLRTLILKGGTEAEADVE
jgi:DNA replication protein DnaC